ncbi:hypothetical protein P7H17_12930 [Paenibacillus larvae]|nr:hypothetical protein [Paenibacillus larvae]MDT2286761.1 hypothetical protein [Paenibacillus larvae]
MDDHERLKLRIKKLEARNEYSKWRTLFQKSWQRSGDDIHANVSPTCRLVSAIQELHAEKGYAISEAVHAQDNDLPIINKLKWNHPSGNLKSFHWPREAKLRYDEEGAYDYRQNPTHN